MDIKPFVKRIFNAYRQGKKQPIKRLEKYLYEDEYYKMTVFEVLKINMSESFWNNLHKVYVSNVPSGQILRVEKNEEKERVFLALLTPYKEKNQES